MLIKILFY